ncbi:unnamed protein product, partial [Effrenium voratum]
AMAYCSELMATKTDDSSVCNEEGAVREAEVVEVVLKVLRGAARVEEEAMKVRSSDVGEDT